MSRTYLDAASGQPTSSAGLDMAERVYNMGWADPNGLHHEGKAAAAVLQASRETVAKVTECDPSAVAFVPLRSAANLVTMAVRHGRGETPTSWAVGAVETAALRNAAEKAMRVGDSARDLSVDSAGQIEAKDLAGLVDSNDDASIILIAQAVNAELGTTQQLEEISGLLANRGAAWICDATGLLGYQDVWAPDRTVLAAAHGFAGPPDAALVIADGLATGEGLATSLADASVSVTSAAATAAALFDLHQAREIEADRLTGLIARLRAEIPARIRDVDVLGSAESFAHTATFSFLYADGERLANELDRRGIAVGSGSACASRAGLPSHVLIAIGALTHGNVRISLPRTATDADIDALMAQLPDAVAAVRAEAGAP